MALEETTNPLRAAWWLERGGLVAFPTETVYGLGVDATNAVAVERLFAVKGRPINNPLIVHIAHQSRLDVVARHVPLLARRLLERFAPGPLTVVVPKQPTIVPAVTAGLDTVGVRIPDHPLALEMLRACHVPIAAPSANRSGRPSATTARSVVEDFGDRIDCLLLGEPTRIGLESTVVDCLSQPPRVLRPGAVTLAMLAEIEPTVTLADATPRAGDNSPGRLHPHYQPAARVMLFDDPDEIAASLDAAYLAMQPHAAPGRFGWHQTFRTIEEFSRQFYEALREVDRRGLKVVYCQRVDSQGSGQALSDRQSRAAEPA